MVKVLCIIQARLTSSRLPNKVLQELGETGLTLLEHLYQRLQQSKLIDKIVCAIPDNSDNDSLAEFLDTHDISYYRGSENNVLSRFYNCAKIYTPEIVIRSTADNPCVDWKFADKLIDAIGNKDYVSGTGGPIGTSLEVFKLGALNKAYAAATEEVYREHVTPFIYRNPDLFSIARVPYYLNLNNTYRLTVDTKDDMELMNLIYKHLYKGQPISNVDIYEFLDENPAFLKINSKVKQIKI